MQFRLKQRFLSWFDSYDIYNEQDEVAFTVEGKLSLAHSFEVYDANRNLIGNIEQKFFSFTPCFEIYKNGEFVGTIKKELTFFKPKFTIEYKDWTMKGDIFEWDYEIHSPSGLVATCEKELFNFTDTYVFNVKEEADVLDVVMLVVAIDAAKCSQND